MARPTCNACWHPAPRGTKLFTWRGLADWETTAANPAPKYKNWTVCGLCVRELRLIGVN
jgi:hypothetical protein